MKRNQDIFNTHISFFFFFPFLATSSIWKFPGQELNPSQSYGLYWILNSLTAPGQGLNLHLHRDKPDH